MRIHMGEPRGISVPVPGLWVETLAKRNREVCPWLSPLSVSVGEFSPEATSVPCLLCEAEWVALWLLVEPSRS